MRGLRDLLTIVFVNLAALGGIVWMLRDPRAGAIEVLAPPPRPTATTVSLHVYVSGAVVRPGVVELSEDARAVDAVTAAGGLASDAVAAAVNLAAPIADGSHIHVPAEDEAPMALVAVPSGLAEQGAATGGLGQADRVNINTADSATLQTLPGIGPALADRIIEYRTANGPFASVDALTDVAGIGDRTLDRVRDRLSVR